MRKHPRQLLICLAFLAAIASACTLPAPSATQEDPSVVYTAAAQTIVAQLTLVGTVQGTPTQPLPPGETPALPGDTAIPPADTVVAPVDTATATATIVETATETPPPPSPTGELSPTPLPSDPRAGLGDPDFQDSFESGENWSLYTDQHVSFDTDDGQLVMTAFDADFWEGWMLSWPELEDFYLEMAATQSQCSGPDRYGLVFRASKAGQDYIGYFFGVTCDGRYSLRRWDGDKFVTIIDWTSAEPLETGGNGENRIGVLAEGSQLSLYANGSLLTQLTDETHQAGRFGLFIGSVNTPDFTVEVDEVSYWENP